MYHTVLYSNAKKYFVLVARPRRESALCSFFVNVRVETAKCIAIGVLERFDKGNVKVLGVVS